MVGSEGQSVEARGENPESRSQKIQVQKIKVDRNGCEGCCGGRRRRDEKKKKKQTLDRAAAGARIWVVPSPKEGKPADQSFTPPSSTTPLPQKTSRHTSAAHLSPLH